MAWSVVALTWRTLFPVSRFLKQDAVAKTEFTCLLIDFK
jgi:hypothetical protein